MTGRTHTSSESRQNARIPSRNGLAGGFQGERAGILPSNATVADVSEGGVRLLFSWPATEAFPLRAGDGLGFVLKVDDQQESFEILGVVRHIKTHSTEDQVTVGVEFTGLEHGLRESLKKSILHMAVTKLRTWQGPRGQEPVAPGEEAPPQAAAAGAACFWARSSSIRSRSTR